jgi:hypothetical protein
MTYFVGSNYVQFVTMVINLLYYTCTMYINKTPYWSKFKQFFPQKWMASSRFFHQIELSIHDNGHQNFFDVCKERMYN